MDKVELRMSGAGKCPRALSAELLGCECEPKPSWLEEAAQEGNWHEARIKLQLRAKGELILDEQRELVLDYPTFRLTGHIDGIVMAGLLEVKTMSQFEFQRWMKEGFVGFPNYLDQVTCYMEALGFDTCLYIVKNRSSGYQDMKVINKLDNYFETIVARLTGVVESVAKGELYPAEFRSDNIECRRCRYKLLCIPKITAMDKATKQELDMAVAEVRDGNKLLAEGEELLKKGKSKLYKHTVASDLKKWQHNDLAVLLVNVKEQITYPKASLLEKYSEEELADVSKVKEAYSYLKLEDLEKE